MNREEGNEPLKANETQKPDAIQVAIEYSDGEAFNGPIVVRFDVGALIVAYGNATVAPPPPPAILLPPAPTRLGTRTSPVLGLGVAFRF